MFPAVIHARRRNIRTPERRVSDMQRRSPLRRNIAAFSFSSEITLRRTVVRRCDCGQQLDSATCQWYRKLEQPSTRGYTASGKRVVAAAATTGGLHPADMARGTTGSTQPRTPTTAPSPSRATPPAACPAPPPAHCSCTRLQVPHPIAPS